MNRQRAEELRRIISQAAQSLDDETALIVPRLYDTWEVGKVFTVGDKLLHNDILYKVLQPHTSQADWPPDVAVSLYARVLSGQDDTIGVWERPESTNPYMTDAKVHFPTINDPIYRSKYDNNIYSPAEWPDGWEIWEG